jgi:nucleotide-binding universal stress UspA family protein
LNVSDIVVGLDLSPSARAALKWAAEQARATGQILRAINAVDVSPAFNIALGMGGVAVPLEPSAMDAQYRKAVASVFDSVQPGLGWRLQFFSGEAAPVLVTESVGASLLVVGTKEHVGIGRLVSGSVSHYCLNHAQCPVVAVPDTSDHTTDKPHDHAAVDANAPT